MGQFLKRLEQASMLIAVAAITLIMLIVSFDAILRYLFNSPLQWSYELVGYYLMVVGIYFALSGTFTSGDHVNITLVRDMLPKRLLAWLDIVWCLVAAVVFALLTLGTWRNTADAWTHKEFIPGYISWPSWLSHLWIPLGAALLVVRLLYHVVILATQGHDDDVNDHGEPME